jgi:hypothetical protein
MSMPTAPTLFKFVSELAKVTDPTAPSPAGAGVHEIHPTGPAAPLEHVEDDGL